MTSSTILLGVSCGYLALLCRVDSFNEHIRLKERHLVFNVPELCKLIAKAFDRGVDEIVRFDKFAEGGSYRIFRATFKDDTEAIARLPFPCTLPKGYGVLSEVATMSFLRKHGLPIPRVYDWNSNGINPVGSEYMIMERVSGTDLHKTWHTMTVEQRLDMVENLVQLETRLFDISLPAYGSVYLKGIHSTEVVESVGHRELRWLQKYGRPRLPQNLAYRFTAQNQNVSPHAQIEALQDYLKLARFIVPEEEEMNRPTIRHQDLSPSNVLVEDGKITGIIDWQHYISLPLFLQARMPSHFNNLGDQDSENFRPPRLPSNFDSMSDEGKAAEEEIYRKRQLHFFYLGATSRYNPRHHSALWFDPHARRSRLIGRAQSPWEGDNVSLKADLIRAVAHWPEIRNTKSGGVDCPVSYSERETEECLAMDAARKKMNRNLQAMRDFLGVGIDGWIPNDDYAVTKEGVESLKAEMIVDESDADRKEIEEDWPFQDHEEID